MKFLSQQEAQDLDVDLMGSEFMFDLKQLMELAGLSCASATNDAFPPSQYPRALVICGPGNNGGDGLVCARHMVHFGYTPTVVVPKPTSNEFFKALIRQCTTLGIPVVQTLEEAQLESHDIVVDAIFGFSFKGSIRAPFDGILATLRASTKPIVCVDIPSGWDVEQGNVTGEGLQPSVLVSLTAPKLCASMIPPTCKHYVGGRFVPRAIAEKYSLSLPEYSGDRQFVRVQ